MHSNLYPHEINNSSGIHFTWLALKASRNNQSSFKKKLIHITHPWVTYKTKQGFKRSPKSKGTLVFFTHHVPGIEWQGHDDMKYLQQLKELPEKFQPVVVCMHMHDVNAGHHKKLRDWGLPIVTIGNVYDDKFIDRFYTLVSQFSYGTSQEWGSQVAYMTELGIPYFFLGKPPVLINFTHKELPMGRVNRFQDSYHKSYLEKSEKLFAHPVDIVTNEQKEFINEVLGINSTIKEQEIRHLIWQSLFDQWHQWHQILLRLIFMTLSSLGIIQLLKRLRRLHL